MPSLGRALRHRNFRLFFSGQSISLIGTWLTRFAMAWMAVQLTHRDFLVGLVAFCSTAPSSLISPVAGVLVDRWNRHRVIVVTQILAMLQSAALAVFAFTGWMTVWDLMWLGAAQAAINAFDMPARQSFLRQMVDDPADLPNAIALNSSMVNAARLVGPSVAALLVAGFGEGWCFTIDAASYLAVIASLLAMRVAPRPIARGRGAIWDEFRDGYRYVAAVPLARTVLTTFCITSVLVGAYSSTLLPLLDRNVLDGSERTLGMLMSSGGVGALAGALYLASRTTTVGLTAVIGRCALGLATSLLLLAVAPSVWVAMPLVFVLGGSMMVLMASTNTILQTAVDPNKLGRVMSLYGVAFFGGAPIGALLEGALSSAAGVTVAFAVAGLLALVNAVAYTRTIARVR